MKRATKRLMILVPSVVLALLALWLGVKFAGFRSGTNYSFASVADFFHQLTARNQVEYEFVDQNVGETAIGPYRLQTMKVRFPSGDYVLRAVGVESAFGTYYRFPTLDFDSMLARSSVDEDNEPCGAAMYALFLDDGVLIEVLCEYPCTDNFGQPAIVFEDDGSGFKAYAYDQFFWVPNGLPKDYLIQCEGEEEFIFTYDDIVK